MTTITMFVFISTIFAIANLSACGPSNSDKGSDSAQSEVLFQGTYHSDCKYMTKLILKNEGTLSELIVNRYLDDLCEKEIRNTTKFSRSYSVVGQLDGTEVYAVDIVYEDVQITLNTASDVALNPYGMTDWKIGEPRSIAGKSKGETDKDLPAPMKGDAFYHVWTTEKGVLSKIEYPGWEPGSEATDKNHRSTFVMPRNFTKD